MKKAFLLIVVVLIATTVIFADIARPGNSSKSVVKLTSVDSSMTIRMDRDAKLAKLIIPRSQLKQLRAELEQLDTDGDNTTAVSTGGISRMQTIMAGTLISLAFVFGGMWFVRSGRSPRSVAIILVLFGIGTAATFVFANVGPPPEARVITSKLFDMKVFTPYRFASGRIKIELSDDSTVQLIVPDLTPAPAGDE